ncbi:MAG: outer membrane protein assembly factor BamD [Candidatus Omnitrophota bacterium]
MKLKSINAGRAFLLILFASLNLSCLSTGAERRYQEAIKEAEEGNTNVAFLILKDYLNEFPQTPYGKDIRFALAEHYIDMQAYRDAIKELKSYLTDYPEDKTMVFVRALIYKILKEYQPDPELIESIESLFFSKSIFLSFSSSKTYTYKSLLNNTYKAVDYIDRITILKNDEILLEVSP